MCYDHTCFPSSPQEGPSSIPNSEAAPKAAAISDPRTSLKPRKDPKINVLTMRALQGAQADPLPKTQSSILKPTRLELLHMEAKLPPLLAFLRCYSYAMSFPQSDYAYIYIGSKRQMAFKCKCSLVRILSLGDGGGDDYITPFLGGGEVGGQSSGRQQTYKRGSLTGMLNQGHPLDEVLILPSSRESLIHWSCIPCVYNHLPWQHDHLLLLPHAQHHLHYIIITSPLHRTLLYTVGYIQTRATPQGLVR